MRSDAVFYVGDHPVHVTGPYQVQLTYLEPTEPAHCGNFRFAKLKGMMVVSVDNGGIKSRIMDFFI